MSNLTSILGSDLISNAPSVLTGNFQNLNQDKVQISSVATNNLVYSNGTATITPISSIGTLNQILTSQGASLPPLFQDANITFPSVLTMIPNPVSLVDNGGASPVTILAITSQSVMSLGKVVIPFTISASILAFMNGTATVADTLDLSLYSEDGATRIFSVTSSSVGVANSLNIVPLTSLLSINPGIYYLGINGNTAGVNLQINTYDTETTTNYAQLLDIQSSVAGAAVVEGTLIIPAGAPPASFTPSVLTVGQDRTLAFRINK